MLETFLLVAVTMFTIQFVTSLMALIGYSVQFSRNKANYENSMVRTEEGTLVFRYIRQPSYYQREFKKAAKYSKLSALALALSPVSILLIPAAALAALGYGIKVGSVYLIGGFRRVIVPAVTYKGE